MPTSPRLPAPTLPDWLSGMLPFERYAVEVGEWRMHVMEAGEGLPVVMLHGNPTWGFLWRKVAAELRGERLRLILPDLVGLGLSEKPRDPSVHTLAFHVGQVGALLDALGLERMVLVVQDWGGPIGMGAMADRASRLAGLVVLNTVLGPPKQGFRPSAFHRFARFPLLSDVAFRVGGFPQVALFAAQGDRRSIHGEVARAYRFPLRGMSENAAPLALARMVPDALEHPSVPGLQRCEQATAAFRGPAAIVWGERDPILGRVAHRAQRLLPDAPLTLSQAGHFLQEEVPGQIAAAVRDVVRRAESGRLAAVH
ncbi:MAG: alpha/beta fold hydrolase [Myxococcaceae bacterium]|nr:alpha/beta fold hydrolase [Myxococcaceae bacterium]MCI0671416.1 alpha/beta fold hydrolase [Myxococcaceae bacterium]